MHLYLIREIGNILIIGKQVLSQTLCLVINKLEGNLNVEAFK